MYAKYSDLIKSQYNYNKELSDSFKNEREKRYGCTVNDGSIALCALDEYLDIPVTYINENNENAPCSKLYYHNSYNGHVEKLTGKQICGNHQRRRRTLQACGCQDETLVTSIRKKDGSGSRGQVPRSGNLAPYTYREDMKETIAAVSTAISTSGISIVRISGPEALDIADRIYRSPSKNKKL